jgi:tetratricopeptide (TPR) repeat protein
MGALNMFERNARVFAAGLALAILAPPFAAQAAPRKGTPDKASQKDKETEGDARRLFREGDRLYSEGDYEGAVTAFERAYQLSGKEALKYNMANAYERLGRYDAALAALRDYLPHAQPEERDAVQRRIEKLQQRVDDQRAKAQPAAANAPASAAPAVTASAEPATADVPPDSGQPPPILGYVALGVGAVGLGVGTFFGIQALSAKSDAEDACAENDGTRRCPARAEDALDDARSKALIADVSLGVGVVAAAVGAYLVLRRGPEKSASSRMLRVSAGQRGGELRVIGTF